MLEGRRTFPVESAIVSPRARPFSLLFLVLYTVGLFKCLISGSWDPSVVSASCCVSKSRLLTVGRTRKFSWRQNTVVLQVVICLWFVFGLVFVVNRPRQWQRVKQTKKKCVCYHSSACRLLFLKGSAVNSPSVFLAVLHSTVATEICWDDLLTMWELVMHL